MTRAQQLVLAIGPQLHGYTYAEMYEALLNLAANIRPRVATEDVARIEAQAGRAATIAQARKTQ